MNDLGGKSFPYDGELTDDDKQMAMLAHMLGILGPLPPLIIWAIKKDQSAFVKKEGMQALVWTLGMTVCAIGVSIIGCIPVVGLVSCLLWPVLLVVAIAHCVVAGLRAKEGLSYEYPLTSKFIK